MQAAKQKIKAMRKLLITTYGSYLHTQNLWDLEIEVSIVSRLDKPGDKPWSPKVISGKVKRTGHGKIVARGGVAQLGERVVRNDEVGSSILLLSTKTHKKASIAAGFFYLRRFINGRSGHP